MTEVLKRAVSFSNNFSTDGPVISVKHYEAKPPANLSSTQIVDPDNVLATTKEEEWVTKKKVELTTKKQIETRVKRQVVLEDGKVVEDSGPIVTTNTTEDTEKQEHEQTEHRQIGDDAPGEGWVAVPNSIGLVKEVRENKIKSREETEERLEIEDVQHLGDITDEAYLKAIQSQRKDLRLALRQGSSELLSSSTPNGRVIHHSMKNRKVIDSENTKHLSEVQNDGRLITETMKTTEHEEINNTAEPDDEDDEDDEDEYETHHKSSQRYRKTKDQELVEYLADGVKVGEEIRFEAENVEGDRRGNPDSLKIDSVEWESLSERIRRMRREKQQKLEEAERMDALTKKPLNFDQEEETRKVETSKWLEHHFGSESRSSHSSVEEDENPKKKKTSTSFINVTMKSTKSPGAQSPPPSSQTKSTFYKGVSEWNGNSSRHYINSGNASATRKTKAESRLSPTQIKKNVYDVKTGSIKKVVSEDLSFSPFQPIKEKTQQQAYSSKYYTERASSPISSPISELEASPLYASIQQKYNHFDKTSSSYDMSSSSYAEKSNLTNGKSTPNGILRSTSPTNHYKSYNGIIKTESHRPERKSSMVKREYLNKSWSRSERRLTDISDSDVQREPDPDYSPRLRKKVPSSPDIRSSPSTDTMRKKIYQKTRFSAEIPLVKRAKPITNSTPRPERKSTSLGDTFRKIIGKFQGNSGERKKRTRSSESPPTENGVSNSVKNQNHYSSYQAFGNVDNHIPDVDSPDVGNTDRSGRNSPSQPKQAAIKYASYEEPSLAGATTTTATTKKRVTTYTPSSEHRSSLTNGSQTLDRNYHRSKKRHDENGLKRSSPAQKYYLGEDPFSGSIYGKEKEYDGARPFRRKFKNGNSTDDEKKSVKNQIMNGVHNILGGRLSKSTNRLSSDSNQRAKKENVDYMNRGVQTLPRKSKKTVFINDPSSDQENLYSRRFLNNNNSNSMINVSVVNDARSSNYKNGFSDILGPQKPARTYRTSLLRSKSFNVQLGPNYNRESTFKSNPQLHKLDESPPPLKSPSIVTSISRSTRDLSKSMDDDFRNDYSKTNGYSYDNTRRTFQKGLKNRTPELYKTLHEDDEFDSSPCSSSRLISSTPIRNKHKVLEYSNSFHSGSNTRKPTVSFESDRHSPQLNKNYTPWTQRSPEKNGGDTVNRTVSRNGSKDDYSETVRITSKSNDPIRPSVTNTVQNFSKKTVPSKDGRLETIESSETTRVTKSHYRGDAESDTSSSRYNSRNNGGVVIEVKKERK